MTTPLLPAQESVREAIARIIVNSGVASAHVCINPEQAAYDDALEAADAILARINSTPTPSGVVRGSELVAAHNRAVHDGTLAKDPRDDPGNPLHDIVCGWCGKIHDGQPPASPDAALIALREECARIAETEPTDGVECLRAFRHHTGKHIAAAIRALDLSKGGEGWRKAKTPGVNCPNCGHRLPADYAAACVNCDALDLTTHPAKE